MISTKGNVKVLLSWSYSVYSQWLACPFSVFLDKIARVRMPEEARNPHMDKGSYTHAITEAYVRSKTKPTAATLTKEAIKLLVKPDSMSGKVMVVDKEQVKAICEKLMTDTKVMTKLEDLRLAKAQPEGLLAFDRNWNITSWTNWAGAWLRVKCDVVKEVLKPAPLVNIVDWKTGKQYEDHRQQRSLYALAGLQLVKLGKLVGGDPKTKVIAEHIYTDTGLSATETFLPTKLEPLKREWLERIKFMMKDTNFAIKEGPACRWCKHAKSRGGSCPADQ